MPDLSPAVFAILVLVAYRSAWFVVFSSLIGSHLHSGTRWAQAVDVWAFDERGGRKPGFGGWLRDKIGTGYTCPFCVGFWMSLAVVCLWSRLYPQDLGVEGWGIVVATWAAECLLHLVEAKLSEPTPPPPDAEAE